MAITRWLAEARHIAQKQHKVIVDKITDLLALKPLKEIDIEKYLSITADERMKQSDKLTDEQIEIESDISELTSLIFFENRRKQAREKLPIE